MMKIYMVVLLVFVTPVNAGIYKWTDSEGNVHFGDRPVDAHSAAEMNIKVNRNTGVTNSSGNKKEREYLLEKIEEDKKANAEKKKEKLAESKKRRKLCDSYRRNYHSLNQSNVSYTMSPDGVRTYQSEDQRIARKKELSRGIKAYCR